jgi:hypothetical protein
LATETQITELEGPKGKAEIVEVKLPDGQPVYELRFNGTTETFHAIGEAYLEAGLKVGVKT